MYDVRISAVKALLSFVVFGLSYVATHDALASITLGAIATAAINFIKQNWLETAQ